MHFPPLKSEHWHTVLGYDAGVGVSAMYYAVQCFRPSAYQKAKQTETHIERLAEVGGRVLRNGQRNKSSYRTGNIMKTISAVAPPLLPGVGMRFEHRTSVCDRKLIDFRHEVL